MEFASSDRSGNRTATEIRLDLTQVQTLAESMADLKESSVGQVLKHMGYLMGVKPDDVGRINVAVDMSAFLFTVADIATAYGSGILSLQSAVSRMQQLGYNQDAEAELNRILDEEQERVSRTAKALKPGELED